MNPDKVYDLTKCLHHLCNGESPQDAICALTLMLAKIQKSCLKETISVEDKANALKGLFINYYNVIDDLCFWENN